MDPTSRSPRAGSIDRGGWPVVVVAVAHFSSLAAAAEQCPSPRCCRLIGSRNRPPCCDLSGDLIVVRECKALPSPIACPLRRRQRRPRAPTPRLGCSRFRAAPSRRVSAARVRLLQESPPVPGPHTHHTRAADCCDLRSAPPRPPTRSGMSKDKFLGPMESRSRAVRCPFWVNGGLSIFWQLIARPEPGLLACGLSFGPRCALRWCTPDPATCIS